MKTQFLQQKYHFSIFILLAPAILLVTSLLGCTTTSQLTQPPAADDPQLTSTFTPITPPPIPEDLTPNPPFPQGSLPSGSPWFVFPGPNTLWAVNADGSDLIQIANQVVQWNREWESGVAPRGGHVAYISGLDDFHNLAINIYSFQTGESRLITPLVSPDLEPAPGTLSERVEAIESITFADSLAWSPDGSLLAFIGAMNGPSSDLYIYSLADDLITRLTDGPSQVYQLRWSPDGEYILHYGIETFGTGAGYSFSGSYAARADNSGIITLSGPFDGDEIVIGWLDARTALLYSWDTGCGPNDLHSLNIETGAEAMLFAGVLDDAVMEPDSGSIVVLVSENATFCNPDGEQGLFLISLGGSAFRFLEDEPYDVQWSPEARLFFARTEFGVVAISTLGDWNQLETLTGRFPAANPVDKSLAWPGDLGLWLSPLRVTPDGPQPEQVFNRRVLFAAWDPSGEYLLFMGADYVSVLHRSSMQIFQVADGVGGWVGVWAYP